MSAGVPPAGGAGGHADEVRSYYGRPIIKAPVWKPEVPWYFFAGGLAGASSMLAVAAELAGTHRLARQARLVAGAGAIASPALLVADLGVPSRFLNMLRVFRPTSPLNVGSWILSAYAPAAIGAAVLAEAGAPEPLRRTASAAAALGGLPMTTYTAVLVADTAVPVWHEARRELPFLFAASAAASAGAAGVLLAPPEEAGAARRLTLLGVAVEQGAEQAMRRRLGFLGRPYHEGRAGRFARAARALTLSGSALTALTAVRPQRPAVARTGAALVLAGAVCLRWSTFTAGWQSAADPTYVVRSQRDPRPSDPDRRL